MDGVALSPAFGHLVLALSPAFGHLSPAAHGKGLRHRLCCKARSNLAVFLSHSLLLFRREKVARSGG